MSNRNMYKDFYTLEQRPVMLTGTFTQVGDQGTPASLSITDFIALNATNIGSAGNFIKFAVVDGGTAGSETVALSYAGGYTIITVTIESGVSTITQVVDAINNSPLSQTLITATSQETFDPYAPLQAPIALGGGVDTVFTSNAKGMTLTQVRGQSAGAYKLTFSDPYKAALSIHVTFTDTDGDYFIPQILSFDSQAPTQSATIRIISGVASANAGAPTAGHLLDGDSMYVTVMFRNSQL